MRISVLYWLHMSFVLLVFELILLFFISRAVTGDLFQLVYRLTKSRRVAVSFVSLLLYPGTIIHELAHLFTAEILGVRTGKLTLVPEGITDEHEVKSGSVMIERTDPLRRALIGLAPFTVGLVFCGVLAYFYSLPINWYSHFLNYPLSTVNYQLLRVAQMYFLFTVSATMFPSSVDMKGAWIVGIVMLFLGIAGFVAGVRIVFSGVIAETLSTLLTSAVHTFFLVLIIQAVLWIVAKIFLSFMK